MQELRVLIADDSEEFSYLLQERLEALQCEVLIKYASNGYEALNIIRNEKVDLLISDFYMPVMNGIELIKSVRRLDECLRPREIILLSAYVEDGSSSRSLDGVKFLPKDDYYSDLVQIVGDLSDDLNEVMDEEDFYFRNLRVDIVGESFVDIVHGKDLELYSVTVHDPHLIFHCEKDEVVDCILSLPGKESVKTKGRVKRLLGLSDKHVKIEFFDLNRENQNKLERMLERSVAA